MLLKFVYSMVPHAFLQYNIRRWSLQTFYTSRHNRRTTNHYRRGGNATGISCPILCCPTLTYYQSRFTSFCSRSCWASIGKPAFIMVEPVLSCAERNASTLGNDVGCKSVGICGLYVCDFVCNIFASITLHSLLDASFTVSLTAYGGPLSSSLLRDFLLLSVHGPHSPWLVIHRHMTYLTPKAFFL